MNLIALCLVSTLVAAVSTHPSPIVLFPVQLERDIQPPAREVLHPAVLRDVVKSPRNLRTEESEEEPDTVFVFTDDAEDDTTTDKVNRRFSAPAFLLAREFLSRNEEGFDAGAEEGPSAVRSLVRRKRQSRERALDLALSHQDSQGNDRAVGQLHGRVDVNGFGQDARNYHANAGAGVGSVLWRSNNNRHSLGAGAYVSQSRGRFHGYRYQSKPQFGAGLGYRFRF